mmetsp:Transcript_4275/g.11145  ORF Transcript_4275/g.11145 Transcript_4275/m.11145 type:complete len:238 (+) Transcript_4275:2026-2739(+)
MTPTTSSTATGSVRTCSPPSSMCSVSTPSHGCTPRRGLSASSPFAPSSISSATGWRGAPTRSQSSRILLHSTCTPRDAAACWTCCATSSSYRCCATSPRGCARRLSCRSFRSARRSTSTRRSRCWSPSQASATSTATTSTSCGTRTLARGSLSKSRRSETGQDSPGCSSSFACLSCSSPPSTRCAAAASTSAGASTNGPSAATRCSCACTSCGSSCWCCSGRTRARSGTTRSRRPPC